MSDVRESKRDHRRAALRMFSLVGPVERLFERPEARVHLGRGDLGVGGLGKAQLAQRESGVGIFMVVANGRPEGAAKNGPMRVKIAGLGRGIEDGTGVGMRPLFKELDLLLGAFVLKENAGAGIAWKEGPEVCVGSGDPALKAHGFGRVFGLCLKQTFAKAFRIERGNLKDSMAARRAAGVAEEVGAGTLDGGGKGSIDNLNEVVGKRNHGQAEDQLRSLKDVSGGGPRFGIVDLRKRMSVIDDTRKVLQDVIAPDLKAINVRLDAVERVMNLRFEQVDKQFEQVDKRFEQIEKRFDQFEKRMDERFAQSEKLTLAKFDQLLSRIELLTSVMGANHEAQMHAMDLNRRMERIESSMAPKLEPGLSKS